MLMVPLPSPMPPLSFFFLLLTLISLPPTRSLQTYLPLIPLVIGSSQFYLTNSFKLGSKICTAKVCKHEKSLAGYAFACRIWCYQKKKRNLMWQYITEVLTEHFSHDVHVALREHFTLFFFSFWDSIWTNVTRNYHPFLKLFLKLVSGARIK